MSTAAVRDQHLDDLRALMAAHSPPLHALLVPSEDAHQSEYVSERDKRRQFISGFTGSAGLALITTKEALLWTDGRYFLQATQQLSDRWKLMRMGEDPLVEVWIADNLPDEAVIGIDPWCISVDSAQRYEQTFSKKRQTLFQLSADLVDEIWKDRPPIKPLPVIVHPVEFAGCTVAEKIKELREKLQHEKASAIIITALDEVAWLYNIRGDDVHYSPVVHSYSIVTLHSAFFYVDKRKVTAEVQNYMTENGIDIREYNMVQSDVSLLVSGHGIVYKGILPYKTVVALKKSTMFDESQVEQFANEIYMDSGKGARLAKWLFMQLKPDGVVYTTLSHLTQHAGKNILEGLIVMFCQLDHGSCCYRRMSPHFAATEVQENDNAANELHAFAVFAHYGVDASTLPNFLKMKGVLNMAVVVKEWTMSGASECKCIAIKKLQVPWDPGSFELDLEDLTTSA